MEKLKAKHKSLSNALNRLEEAINILENLNQKMDKQLLDFVGNEDLRRSLRDSLIQRFEFTVDLFWKYLKKVLEFQLKQPSEINTPRAVIESACKAKIISEQDAEEIIEMIKCRNKTSHIYLEEISDVIATQIPAYYKIIKKYVEKLSY